MPFWIAQIVEYALGVLALTQVTHAHHALAPLVSGLLVLAVAATADGPASAFHLVPRPAHRVVVVLTAAVVAVLAAARWSSTGAPSSVGLVVVAAALLLVAVRIDVRPPAPRRRSVAAADRPRSPEEIGQLAGRVAAKGIKAWRGRRR